MRRLRILTIDGGGILGVIPAMILAELERKLQKRTNNPNARIADFFDFFAGTSTGGIITALLLIPDPKDKTRPKYDTKEIVEFYSKTGPGIFKSSFLRKALGSVGLVSDKYDVAELERLLKKNLGTAKLSELLKPCLIPAFHLEMGATQFFCSHDHQNGVDPSRDFFMRDATRATSAAPSYFEPASIFSASESPYSCIDGGVFANNPALCALAEAGKTQQKYTPENILLLSLGTGKVKKVFKARAFQKRIALLNIPDLISIMMGGVAETTHHIVKTMFSNAGVSNQYFRLDPDVPDPRVGAMDNATPENIGQLRGITEAFIAHNESAIDDLVDALLADQALESTGEVFSKAVHKIN